MALRKAIFSVKASTVDRVQLWICSLMASAQRRGAYLLATQHEGEEGSEGREEAAPARVRAGGRRHSVCRCSAAAVRDANHRLSGH